MDNDSKRSGSLRDELVAASSFSVERRPDGDRVYVVPHGEIDLATAWKVAAAIDDVAASGAAAVVLDLRSTAFLDSSGLRMLIAQCARTDTTVTILDGPPTVRRVFDVSGVRAALRFEREPA